MGFLDSFRVWLKRLFQTEPRQSKARALPFETVPSWIEQETDSEFEELEQLALNRFSEIRFLLKEIRSQLDALEKKRVDEEPANERLQRVVSSSQQTMVSRMRILLEKLEPPKTPQWKEIRSYASNAFGLLQKETELFGKNIAYTSLLHREEVKGIGQHLSELEQILKGLFDSFSANPLVERTQLAKNLHQQMTTLQQEIQSLERESKLLEQEQKQFAQKLSLQQSALAETHSSPEAKVLEEAQRELQNLSKQKEALHRQLSDLIGEIDKPLKRFSQLVTSNQWALEKQQAPFLSLLLENPPKAFETDPKGQSFKEILKELLSAVDQKRISFKDEKEEAKRRAAIQHLMDFDFFSNFFWKENELEKKRYQIEKQIQSEGWSVKLEEQQVRLQRILSEKNALEETFLQHRSALQKNRLLFEEKKILLEKKLSEIGSETISLSFSGSP